MIMVTWLTTHHPIGPTHPGSLIALLVLHALLVIFLGCVSLFVDARPRRIEDVREPDEA